MALAKCETLLRSGLAAINCVQLREHQTDQVLPQCTRVVNSNFFFHAIRKMNMKNKFNLDDFDFVFLLS